jgi:hypothetical protein
LQLGPLFVLGYQVALHPRSKAPLKTDGELLEREESSDLIDPSEKVFFAIERRAIGADHSEHNDFTFRHNAQWLEVAGTLVFVFEEDAIDGSGRTDISLLTNR